jgi:hypothetical protein
MSYEVLDLLLVHREVIAKVGSLHGASLGSPDRPRG